MIFHKWTCIYALYIYIYIWMYLNVFILCISMYFNVFLCTSVFICIYMYLYVPWSKHCLWDMVVHPTIEIVTELVVCKSLLTDWWPSPQQLGQSSIYIYLPFFVRGTYKSEDKIHGHQLLLAIISLWCTLLTYQPSICLTHDIWIHAKKKTNLKCVFSFSCNESYYPAKSE